MSNNRGIKHAQGFGCESKERVLDRIRSWSVTHWVPFSELDAGDLRPDDYEIVKAMYRITENLLRDARWEYPDREDDMLYNRLYNETAREVIDELDSRLDDLFGIVANIMLNCRNAQLSDAAMYQTIGSVGRHRNNG